MILVLPDNLDFQIIDIGHVNEVALCGPQL